jgi:hypothetical protein
MNYFKKLFVLVAALTVLGAVYSADVLAADYGSFNPTNYNQATPWGTAGWGHANVGAGNYSPDSAAWAGIGWSGGSVGIGLGYGGQGDFSLSLPGMGNVVDLQW